MIKFDEDLAKLKNNLKEMGQAAQTMVGEATSAVIGRTLEDIDHIQKLEDKLDKMQVEIDSQIVQIITVHSPVATGLRYLMTASHVNTAFERIGDQAINLIEDVKVLLDHDSTTSIHPKIEQMCPLVSDMMNDALDAYIKEDTDKADATMSRDDLIDALKDSLIAELMETESTTDVGSILSLILIGRALERIADQACNVCEEVFYMVKGEDIRHSDH